MSPSASVETARIPSFPTRSWWLRRERVEALVCIAGLHILLSVLLFDPLPYNGGDNAVYISLARALAEHGAYIDLHDPASPPHAQYPPVFPLVLAGAILLGINSLVGLKIVVMACSVAGAGLSYLWLRIRTSPAIALAVGLVLALSPGIVFWNHWVLSDVPFWMLTMLALWAFEVDAESPERNTAWMGIGATVLAFFTRSAGLPLVIATTAYLALRRRWKPLAVQLTILMALGAAWTIRMDLVGGSTPLAPFWFVNPYDPDEGVAALPELLSRIGENTRRYSLHRLPSLLLVGAPIVSSTLLIFLCSILLTALAIFGWVRSCRRRGVAEFFLPLYLGLFLIWPPAYADDRFLLPILSLILGYAAIALRAGLGNDSSRSLRRLLFALPLFWFVNNLPGLYTAVRAQVNCTQEYFDGRRTACLPENWASFFKVAESAGDRLPPGAVVLSRKPSLFYLFSGRRGRMYPMSPDPAVFFREAEAAGAGYVVLDELSNLAPRYLYPVVGASPGRFCLVLGLSQPRAVMLRIRSLEDEVRMENPAERLRIQPCR